jgi:transcription termination factor Rho
MSEPQLERSVLEAKDREELYAIADALGTKPGSRAKKADLITQILRATGVEGDGGAPEPAEKPRRTRAKKAVGDTAGASEAAPATDQPADGEAKVPVGTGGAGRARAANGKASAGRPTDTAGLAGTSRQLQLAAEDPGTGTGMGTGRSTAAAMGAGRQPPAEAARRSPAAARTGRPPTSDDSGGPPAADDTGGGPVAFGRALPAAAPGDSAAPPAEAATNGSEAAAATISTVTDRPPSGPNHQPVQAHQAGPTHQGGQQGAGPREHGDRQPRFEAEPGNRRNRRRRGRERGDRPERTERSERDLPGQGGEQQFVGEPIPVKGFLDLRDEGYGFLRTKGFLAGPNDVYVSISQVRRFALRKGDEVEGASRPAASNEKYPALLRMDTVNGLTPDEARQRPKFEDLTPLFPDEKMRLEVPGDAANMTARIVDLISPIGKGQRGLIVSPPKAGKTTVLKQIAHSIEANNPEVHLMVLLVDERPEEVTDMRRSVKGEVIASTFDRPSDEHTQVAELAIERAKRLVEMGKDVVIVLDGITRLARAYNLAQPATGRIMSGGIDTGALYPPKKFFGSARNIEEGGSLTILATALVETGSRMDEVIFEEFKGTGNMELRLDRRLAERRIYPALDVNASSTRHEELLFDRTQLQQVWKLRRVLNALGSEGSDAAGLQLLMDKIKTTRSNDEFLAEIAKTPTPAI